MRTMEIAFTSPRAVRPKLGAVLPSRPCVGCATNLSLARQPCPLGGCPMFADFRVHGLNKMGASPLFLFL